jgi:hypothetical protein
VFDQLQAVPLDELGEAGGIDLERVRVDFERICRENGITARRTRPRSPTTLRAVAAQYRRLATGQVLS